MPRLPLNPRIARVGEICVVERIYRSSFASVFSSNLGLWGCGFVCAVFAYVCVRLCRRVVQ